MADQGLSYRFPLNNYNQRVTDWINPQDPIVAQTYDKPLLSIAMQKARLIEFYDHYYGNQSPWNSAYIQNILNTAQSTDLNAADFISIEQMLLRQFSNYNYIYDSASGNYIKGQAKPLAERGRNNCDTQPYTDDWINSFEVAININKFSKLVYDPLRRGITVDNLNARLLPTEEAYFLDCTLPGEGPPFDYLQDSAVWAGTPVYILGEAVYQGEMWNLVVTPDLIAWVKNSGIALTSESFIQSWQATAKAGLVAINSPINKKNLLITDIEQSQPHFLGYIGAIFPLVNDGTQGYTILISSSDNQQQAQIHHSYLSNQDAVKIPYLPTPRHMTEIINNLVGRPYGWGNFGFNNDCSAELKSLYTPFGIYLPRHSSEQVKVGYRTDLSSQSPAQRLSYTMQNAHPFMTIVYITGHVFMILGNYPNPFDGTIVPLTYQNRWGMRPKMGPDMRAVIGQAVLFPMLMPYPEDTNLLSLLEDKYFRVSFIDQLPNVYVEQHTLQHNSDKNILPMLMLPERLPAINDQTL